MLVIVHTLEKVSSSTHLQAFGSIDGPQGSKYSKDPENLHHRDGRRPECKQIIVITLYKKKNQRNMNFLGVKNHFRSSLWEIK